MRLAIADPPYPLHLAERHDTAGAHPRITQRSRSQRYYGEGPTSQDRYRADFHPEAGEWDRPARHRLLLETLHDTYDGYVIATSIDGLDCYGPLPVGNRVMIWRKLTSTRGGNRIANTLEAVIVCTPPSRRGLRDTDVQVPDFLQAEPPAGSNFAGAKPFVWTRWVLDALAYNPETDTVADLFPGSGYVARALDEARHGTLL